jgi:hypothetical protein
LGGDERIFRSKAGNGSEGRSDHPIKTNTKLGKRKGVSLAEKGRNWGEAKSTKSTVRGNQRRSSIAGGGGGPIAMVKAVCEWKQIVMVPGRCI